MVKIVGHVLMSLHSSSAEQCLTGIKIVQLNFEPLVAESEVTLLNLIFTLFHLEISGLKPDINTHFDSWLHWLKEGEFQNK